MITGKQLRIFQVLSKQPFAELALKQVKQQAKEKSNNALSLAVKKFCSEGIARLRRVGRSSLISLNLDNDLSYYYIGLANAQRMGPAVKKSVAVIREAVGKITQFYCMAVFGSYAVQEQGKASDLDVAVIVESAEKRELIEAALAGAAQKTLLPIDAHVITRDEFIEMLANDDENLGKQIARKHLAVHNNMIFYSMVREGMKRGFDV